MLSEFLDIQSCGNEGLFNDRNLKTELASLKIFEILNRSKPIAEMQDFKHHEVRGIESKRPH